MDKPKRELAARVVKVGVAAVTGGWKQSAGEAVTQFVDAWAGTDSRVPDELRDEIDNWAADARYGAASVDLAFRTTGGLLADHGASFETIARLDRDSGAVAAKVL